MGGHSSRATESFSEVTLCGLGSSIVAQKPTFATMKVVVFDTQTVANISNHFAWPTIVALQAREMVPKQAHNFRMIDKGPPTLQAHQLKDGSAWYIVLTWPNGQTENIDGFSSETEINEWVTTKYRGWLAKHEGQKHA